MSKQTDYNLIIPFSDEFKSTWDLWKGYKQASHNFKYKSVFSEQAALEQLVTLSKGDEETAVKIIKQSMRREWQGLFPLHETTTGENGKSKQSGSTKDKAGSGGTLRERVQAEFNRRNGNGQQSGDEPYLKAV